VPHEKMHKITYQPKDLELHELYRKVRESRTNNIMNDQLESVWKAVVEEFPEDWLLSLEILEIVHDSSGHEKLSSAIYAYLQAKKVEKPQLNNLITNGLKLLKFREVRSAED
jgi:phenylalanine-4-hydroxylase